MKRLGSWLFADGDRSPEAIRERVLATPTPSEAIVAGSIVAILLLSSGYPGHGIDWEIFEGAADGRFVSDRGLGFYYAYWLLALFDLFGVAGAAVGGILWSVANVAGAWFASRVFGARSAVVMAGFGALSAFYTGTITGIALAALAGFWWALHARSWLLAGALTLVASAKPQWGAPLMIVMLLEVRPPVRVWASLSLVPLLVALGSLAAFGWWPGDIIERASALPPEGNGSLWHFVGPGVVILWLPILLPMPVRDRLAAVAAASMLAMPYVQQYDQMVLWVFAGDGLGLISHLTAPLDTLFGEDGARAVLTIPPLIAYGWVLREPVGSALARARGRWSGSLGGVDQPA